MRVINRTLVSFKIGIFMLVVGNILNLAGAEAWCRLRGFPSSMGFSHICGDGTPSPAWIKVTALALLLLGAVISLAFIFNLRTRKINAEELFDVPGRGAVAQRRRPDLATAHSGPSRTNVDPWPASSNPSPLHDPLVNPLHPLSPLHSPAGDAESSRRADSSCRSYDCGVSDSSSSSSSDSGSSCSSSCD
jgi:hypothetical protein